MDAKETGSISYYDERLTAWKVHLPVLDDGPVLAVGLDNTGLLCLARSWRQVHAWMCDRSDVEIASSMAQSQGLDSAIKMVGGNELHELGYHAIAVGPHTLPAVGLGMLYRHLMPGGSLVYIGGHAGIRGFPSQSEIADGRVARYMLLPATDTKVIIPLAKRAMARAGLNFYTPRRWHKRMAIRLGGLAMLCGAGGLLGGKQMLKVTKPGLLPEDAYLFDMIGGLVGMRISDATTYIGNNTSLQRRTTLQVFDDNGRAVAVAKVGDTVNARDAALRESAALSSLGQVESLKRSIPRTIAVKDWHGHSVSIQEYVPFGKTRYSTSLTKAHLGFLESLCRTGQHEMPLMDWPVLRQLEKWAEEGRFDSVEDAELVRKSLRWCRDRFGPEKFVFHWAHGDFSPWNTLLMDDGRLMVLDWEFSSPDGLPFYDLLHFVLKLRGYFNKPLSLAGLFSTSAEELGVDGHVSALCSLLPNFKNVSEEGKRELLKAHFILSFAILSMGRDWEG